MRLKTQFHNIDTLDVRFSQGSGWHFQRSLINIAKTEFILNSYLRAARESMHLMVVDTFDTADGIDDSKSTGYSQLDGRIFRYLFYDDFSNQAINTSKWQVSGGTWVIENGELSGTADSSTNNYVLSTVGWSDYIYTCDIWIKSPPWDAGFIFRAQDWYNHYLLTLLSTSGTTGNNMGLYRCVEGSYENLGFADPNIPDDTKVTISIHVLDSNITIYVNGIQTLTRTDSTFLSGKVGCRVYNGTHAHFDNLMVTLPNTSPPSSLSVVVSVPEILQIVPAKIFFTADDFPGSGTISYYASRDGGTTWTPVQKDSVADLSSQPQGQSLVVKAELTGNAYISAWAYGVA